MVWNKNQLISNIGKVGHGSVPQPFKEAAPLLTPRRVTREAWNKLKVRQLAKETGKRCYTSPAVDTDKSGSVSARVAMSIQSRAPKLRADLPDHIDVVVGMECMLTKNICAAQGLMNGSRGKIVGICLDHRETISGNTEVRNFHTIMV